MSNVMVNERPLELVGDGSTEVVRRYRVTVHTPELVDDDGTPISYPVEIALRYEHKRAERRPARSHLALVEAARRAVKMERRTHRMPEDRVLDVDPDVDVEFLYESVSAARAAA